jgi:hypothetical protein
VKRPPALVGLRRPATSEPQRSVQSSGNVRELHPLLGRFPLTVMALAAVLLLFSLAMARLNAGEPDLRASASVSLVTRSTGAETSRQAMRYASERALTPR